MNQSYGLTSVTNGASGVNTWNWSVTFSTTTYGVVLSLAGPGLGANNLAPVVTSQTATALGVLCERSDGTDTDPTSHYAVAFGDL